MSDGMIRRFTLFVENGVGEVVVFVNKEVNLLLHLGTLLAQES